MEDLRLFWSADHLQVLHVDDTALRSGVDAGTDFLESPKVGELQLSRFRGDMGIIPLLLQVRQLDTLRISRAVTSDTRDVIIIFNQVPKPMLLAATALSFSNFKNFWKSGQQQEVDATSVVDLRSFRGASSLNSTREQ
jgi:hypothetical protein